MEESPPPVLIRKKSKVHKGEGLWLMSFSDMSLILMSFFVLQLAYSSPDRQKYDNLNSAIQKKVTITDKVKDVIKKKNLEKVADVTYDLNGVAIEFKDATLFASGSAEPNPEYVNVVGEVMQVIAKAPKTYKLLFEGHTDDVKMTSGKFHSNWDLSAARGIALLESFKARGVSERRMTVQAFAHTRPKVAYAGLKGDELKKARAANRRVVIRIQ
jgi:chemotaxis protein MotB